MKITLQCKIFCNPRKTEVPLCLSVFHPLRIISSMWGTVLTIYLGYFHSISNSQISFKKESLKVTSSQLFRWVFMLIQAHCYSGFCIKLLGVWWIDIIFFSYFCNIYNASQKQNKTKKQEHQCLNRTFSLIKIENGNSCMFPDIISWLALICFGWQNIWLTDSV